MTPGSDLLQTLPRNCPDAHTVALFENCVFARFVGSESCMSNASFLSIRVK